MNRWVGMVVSVLFCVVSAGCAWVDRDRVSLENLSTSNQSKLIRMSLGMTKIEVMALMETATAKTIDGVVNNPWIAEGFTDKDGAQYEVLFYVTRKNPLFTPMRKSLTTPVVLKDGKVIGWGDDALQRVAADKTIQQ